MNNAGCDVAALARRALGDDQLAFGELVDHFSERLLRFFAAMGIAAADGDDLCQVTFVRAWQARRRYDPRYALSTWIFTIARRLAINHCTRRRRNTVLDEQALTSPAEDGEPADHGLWTLAREQLKPRQYELLWLRYGEDLDLEAMATVLGISALNARVSLHRARERFRLILRQLRPDLAAALDPGDAA
jgi:RNA polymerase sigma-70 factor (ECF subfamily)